MYYIYNSNIKYIDLFIKYIIFELINYIINTNAISFFIVFIDFDSIFLLIYY